ncbi:hypothetical protein [Paraherbaspirillum soli]|uniref:Uncharacterized protein n=1 Tax=Paraherbaspirillum soli TaxID=631222 RepID=A0ABW0MDS0_9BURK
MKLKYSYVNGGVHPICGQTYIWQQEAIDSDDALRYQLYICNVLGAVAQTFEDCDRLLRVIGKIECGKEIFVETGGNDVTLTLRPSGVQVDIEINKDWVGQPEGQFTLQEWRVVLEGWRRFLDMPRSFESVVEIDM